jgi:antirestriction protein ArdC
MSNHARSKPAYRKHSTSSQTSAQEQASALRDSIEANMEALAEEMKAGISDRLKAVLEFGARFHKYSPNNVWAILDQCPHATQVSGYRTWEKMGYHVAKGQHGIRIFAPRPYQRVERDESGEETTISKVTFTTVAVFDASQLSPDDLAAKPLPAFFGDLGSDEQTAELAERMIAAMRAAGITVDEREIAGSTQGYSAGGHVALREGLSSRNKVGTLAHEWAHELLHQGEAKDAAQKMSRGLRECHAEAAAYVVLAHFGIRNEISSDYLQNWGNTPETLMAELAQVQKAASAIIAALEPKADAEQEETDAA